MAKSFFNFESARGAKYREYGTRLSKGPDVTDIPLQRRGRILRRCSRPGWNWAWLKTRSCSTLRWKWARETPSSISLTPFAVTFTDRRSTWTEWPLISEKNITGYKQIYKQRAQLPPPPLPPLSPALSLSPPPLPPPPPPESTQC